MPDGSPRRNSSTRHGAALFYVLFFLSGGTALGYQVLWLRRLADLFGASAFAASATLGAFMAGLGVGGYLGARWAARTRSPLLLYGLLEAALAGAVWSVGPLLAAAEPLFTAIYAGGTSPIVSNAARATLALAVLLLPTLLMGATLPALAQAIVRSPLFVGRSLGLLYACNTIGAAAGALLAGFVLLEHVGLRHTEQLAMATNVLIGIVAIVWSRKHSASVSLAESDASVPPDTNARLRRSVLTAYALSGAAALVLEVVWTRALILHAGSTTYAFTVMVVVVLIGISAGSLLVSRVVDAWQRPARPLAIVLALTGAAATLGFLLLGIAAAPLQRWVVPDPSFTRMLLVTFALAAMAILLPAAGFGAVFPIVARHQAQSAASVGQVVGRAYAANLFGCVIGAYVGGFVLVPMLGLTGTLRVVASMLCLAAAALWHRESRSVAGRFDGLTGAFAALALLPFGVPLAHVHHQTEPGESLVYYREGASATVSVVQDQTGAKTLFVDRMSVAGTDPVMQTDQKSLAHIPMLVHPDPRRILTVGFGSGGASWSYTRYPTLERADCVEIAPEVVGAAPHLREANHDLFDDPRYRIILDDARAYLRHTSERYDIIATDCTDLRYKGNASLYTKEYFGLCRLRLRPKGLVTVWMPLGGLSEDLFKLSLRTFAEALPYVSVWYMNNYPTHYVLLVGSEQPHEIGWEAMLDRLQTSGIREDLASIHLDNPLRVASTFLLDDAAVRRYVKDGEINSDDRPLLEFRAPRVAGLFTGARNLEGLIAAAGDSVSVPIQVAYGDAQQRTVLDRLQPYLRAARLLNRGHVSYQSGTRDFDMAIRYYRAAARENPGDSTLPALIQSTERTRDLTREVYRTAAERPDASAGALHNYALSLIAASRPADAAIVLRRLVAMRPQLAGAHVNLARAARLAGEAVEATRAAERAVELAPLDAEAHFELGQAREAAADLTAALAAYQRANTLNPNLAEALFNAGTLLVRFKRFEEARQAYQSGLARRPESAVARMNFAQLLLLLGDTEAARRELQRVMGAGGDVGAAARQLLETMSPP